MLALCSSFSMAKLVLPYLSFNLEVIQLVAQPLCFDPQRFTLLLPRLDLLLGHYTSFNRLIVFRLKILQ